MKAQTSVKREQTEIIDCLSEMEGLVAQLYDRFGEVLPEHREFWTSLANEESMLCRMLQSMHGILAKGSVFYNMGRFDAKAARAAVDLVWHMIELSRAQPISQLQALTTALQIEAMIEEAEFCATITSDPPEDAIIARRFVTEVKRHGATIHDMWHAEARRAHETAGDGSARKARTPAMLVRYDKTLGCIVGQFKGVMDISAAKRYTTRVVHVGGEYYCTRFLNDLRHAVTDFSGPVLYDMLGLLDFLGMDRSWTRAVLVSNTSRDCDTLERLAKASGYTVRVFTDRDEAVTWLTSMR